MKVLLFHISDIHIRDRTDDILSRAQQVASVANHLTTETTTVYITVTGDIAFSGKESEYALAEAFLLKISDHLREAGFKDVAFVMTPGNHDCDFTVGGSVRDDVIAALTEETVLNSLDQDRIEQCTAIQASYFAFEQRLQSAPPTHSDRLWVRRAFQHGTKQIVFDCINAAWMSQLPERQGKLLFPINRYKHLAHLPNTLHVALLHQPLNWQAQATYHPLRVHLRATTDLVLSGHEHVQAAYETDDSALGGLVQLEAGPLSGANPADSHVQLVLVDLDNIAYVSESYTRGTSHYSRSAKLPGWESLRAFPRPSLSDFPISSSFAKVLNDPGAPFEHPGTRDLKLSDIFVFPDMRTVTAAKDVNSGQLSSRLLLQPTHITPGVLIQGSEKTGKTSLLYELYKHFHSFGFVPVLITGGDFTKAYAKSPGKLIEDSFSDQYGPALRDRYNQLPKADRILLFDDLDFLKGTDDLRKRIVHSFLNTFGALIVTSSEYVELDELTDANNENPLVRLQHYRLLPFGHKLRHDLIEKWNSIGDGFGTTTQELEQHVDRTEKLTNTVIGKNLVPAVPLYLLTLMQSFGTGSQHEVQNAGFGYYYHYLIVRSLRRVNVGPEDVDELFNYCAHLAWTFHTAHAQALQRAALSDFNKVYSDTYTPISLDSRLAQLTGSRLLAERNGSYSFCYPYIYYYFLGLYLARTYRESDTQERIQHYCKHLYIPEYANSVLFLLHHAREDDVINSICSVLAGLFAEHAPVRLDDDTKALNEIISSTPQLVFIAEDSSKSKKDLLQEKDRAINEDGKIDEAFEPELDGPLDLKTQLRLTFKTVSILGQIVRNYYGSIKNPDKERLITHIFDGPLRAMSGFFKYIHGSREGLVKDVEAALRRDYGDQLDTDVKALAKKIVFDIVGLATFNFVYKAATATASEHLRPVIRALTKRNDSNAYKLIELATELEFPGNIPFERIEALGQETQKNIFVHRLLETMVVRHLYMYRTTDADKQRLCSKLGIDIKFQRGIDFRAREMKKLS